MMSSYEVERHFCIYCRDTLVSGKYHIDCYNMVQAYQNRVFSPEDRKGYHGSLEIRYGTVYSITSAFAFGQRIKLNKLVVYGGFQQGFIDLIYRDLKQKFKEERIVEVFPLKADHEYIVFEVVKGWVIYFFGQESLRVGEKIWVEK